MTLRFWRSALLMTATMFCFGCNLSLQSSQYTFVKNLLKSEPHVVEKNWQVSWDGRDYPVFAVNHKTGIYFANESGLLVSFDGAHVTSLSLPGATRKQKLRIAKMALEDGAISLEFQNENGRIIGRHVCMPRYPVTSQVGLKGWDQRCDTGSEMYTNEIRTNDENYIVALKQVLMPGSAAIVIAQRP